MYQSSLKPYGQVEKDFIPTSGKSTISCVALAYLYPRKIVLWTGFLVFVFSSAGLGCSKEAAQNMKMGTKVIRMDTRSELTFDQIVVFAQTVKGEIKKPVTASGDSYVRNKTGGTGKLSQEERVDLKYQALNRFEQPLLDHDKEQGQQYLEGGEVFLRRDRKLIFAGDGFDIKDFEVFSNEKLNTDFYSHVRPPSREIIRKREPEHLDLNEKNFKSKKNLIFHPSFVSSTGEKNLVPDRPEGAVPVSRKNKLPAREISKTKVLLTQKPGGVLKLRSDENALDLLIGDEKVNISQFKNR